MKMIFAVINSKIAAEATESLVIKGFPVTRMASSGGFLKKGNATIMSCLEDEQVRIAVQTIKDVCEKKKLNELSEDNNPKKNIDENLAVLFVLPVENSLYF